MVAKSAMGQMVVFAACGVEWFCLAGRDDNDYEDGGFINGELGVCWLVDATGLGCPY